MSFRVPNEQTLGTVIRELLVTLQIEDKLKETQMIASWEEIVGKMIAKHTKSLRIVKRVLYVEVDSAALRNELTYLREKIKKKLTKKAGNNYYIALSKLADLSNAGDAEITLYNLQAEKITASKTNAEGFAEFKNIREDAAVIKIVKGNQQTYLSLDPNQSNPLTEFDIAGERSETDTEFFAYADRDIWRPGDSIYVDLMINKSHSDMPSGMPLVMTFYNTENMVIDEQIQQINTEKKLIHTFKLYTSPSAKTGVYRCVFQIGPKSVRKNIRIETIKPNTAEVIYSFAGMSENTIYDDKLSGTLNVRYLTGFEVGNAKVKASGKARKISQPFSEFKDYIFDRT